MALNLGELFGTIGLDASDWDKKLKGAQGSLKAFGVAGVALAATAAVAIGAALSKGIADSIDIEAGQAELKAQLGLTATQAGTAGKAAGNLYANNFGGSMEEVQAGVGAVMSSIKGMRDASSADVEAMTGKMLNLSKVMGVDVGRASQVAGQMITSGIAKDGAQAADLLTASLQKVPANVREDILDAVDEYGPFMNNLGIKGEEAMGLLVQSSEKGMYGIDKTGDALKEFGIRATDMSTASAAGYDLLGMNQEKMSGKLLAGGDTAKKAFGDIIHGLQEMKDPVKQSQAALALFGTPLEDLSVTEIPNFLGALDPMGDKFDSVAGAADQMGTDLSSSASAGFDGFKRQADAALIAFVQDNIMPSVKNFASFLNTDVGPAIKRLGDWVKNDALPALGRFSQWFTDNLPVITNWATGIGFILIPLFLRIAISAAVSAAAQVVAWATAAGGAITTAAVYVAQAYIMIGRWVAMAAAAVVSGAETVAIWTLYKVEAIKGAAVYVAQSARVAAAWVAMSAAAVVSGIKSAAVWTAQVVATAVTSVVSFLVQTALVVGGWVAMATAATVNAIKMAVGWTVGVVVPAAAAAITFLIGVATVVGGWIAMAAGAMVNAAIMAAAWLVAFWPVALIGAAVIALVALIIMNWEAISKFTSEAWTNIVTFLSEAWTNITTFISDGIENVLSFFRDLPGKIGEVFAGAGQWLFDAGTNIVNGLLDGVKSVAGTIGSFFLSLLPGWIVEPFKLALGIHSPSRVFKGFGQNIGQGLLDGVDGMQGKIDGTMGGLVTVPDLPSVVSPAVSMASGTAALAGPPAAAGGGASGESGAAFIQKNYFTEREDAEALVDKVWARARAKFAEAGIRV